MSIAIIPFQTDDCAHVFVSILRVPDVNINSSKAAQRNNSDQTLEHVFRI